MARTQRRRQHHAENATARVSAAVDEVWQQLAETLDGLLRVEFPSPFTNLELLCPKDGWLVIDLTSIRANGASLRFPLARTLDALTKLLVLAEIARPWSNLYESFWTRVLTSEMLAERREKHGGDHTLWVTQFVRFARAKGTHVAFEWRGRSLDSDHVARQLKKWMATVVDVAMDRTSSTTSRRHVPVQVALRFEECQLRDRRLRALYSLLTVPDAAAGDKSLLCDAYGLRELSLRGTILHAHALQELALVLEDPSTRRIDGLTLDGCAPRQAQQTAAYTASFRRVITAILSKRSVDDAGVSLSLENWSIYGEPFVEVLMNALIHATRPLRALSLACWSLPDDEALARFGRLLLTTLPTATDEFDLDVSCVRGRRHPPDLGDDVEEAVHDARTEMISEALPRISHAVAAGTPVSCRFLCWAIVAQDPAMSVALDVELSSSHYYEVRQVTPEGQFQIVVSTAANDGEVMTGWTDWWSLANVRIGKAYVLRCASSGLIVDRCRRPNEDHESRRLVQVLTAVTGAELTRLSMRHNPWNAEQYVSRCPQLEELNAEGCRTGYPFWTWDPSIKATAQSLQVVNVACCGIDTATLKIMLAFPMLRSLSVAYNSVDVAGFEAVRDQLVTSSILEIVDLSHVGFDLSSRSHHSVRKSIERLVLCEHVSTEARMALVHVLHVLELRGGFKSCFSLDIIELILSFTHRRARRIVEW